MVYRTVRPSYALTSCGVRLQISYVFFFFFFFFFPSSFSVLFRPFCSFASFFLLALFVCYSFFNAEINSVRSQVAAFCVEEQAVQAEEESLPSPVMASFKGRVSLNVGGQVFFSTVAVLTSDSGSLFCTVLGGFANVMLSNDALFIDRDPGVFQLILDFLNRGSLGLEDLSASELELLAWDAHFYELDDLSHALGCSTRVGDPVDAELLDERESGISFVETLRRATVNLEVRRKDIRRRKERILRQRAKAERWMNGKVVSLQGQSGAPIMTLLSTLTAQDGPLSRRFARSDLWSGDDVMKDGSVFVDENNATLKMVRPALLSALLVCFFVLNF